MSRSQLTLLGLTWLRTAAVLVAAALIAISWNVVRAPEPVRTLVVLAGLALTVWAVQPPGGLNLIGPLAAYDAARLSRRGRTTLLRTFYGLGLLGWLCLAYFDQFGWPGDWRSLFEPGPAQPFGVLTRFSGSFLAAVTATQGSAVFVLTPAYVAAAVAEEKERRTLELLFTTHLRDREIVLGKLFGRLLHLAGILLIGLPVLSLTRLWGGVDEIILLASFAVTVLTLLSVGGISILCSVVAPTVLTATVSSYALVFFLAVCCIEVPGYSPFTFLRKVDQEVQEQQRAWLEERTAAQQLIAQGVRPAPPLSSPPDVAGIVTAMLIPGAALHGVIFVGCAVLAVHLLRPTEPPLARPALPPARVVGGWGMLDEPRRSARAAHDPPVVQGLLLLQVPDEPPPPVRWDPPWRATRHPPDDGSALLWKETAFGGVLSDSAPNRPVRAPQRPGLVLCLLALCLLPSVTHLWAEPAGTLAFSAVVNVPVQVVSVVLAGAGCVGVAFRVAGCISRERDRQTLETLLMLPVERDEILRAKWLASLLIWRVVGYFLMGELALGLLFGGLHPWAAVLLPAAVAAHVAFLASLGVWLSLACRNTLWANLSMALVVLVFFTGSFLGMTAYEVRWPADDADWLDNVRQIGLSPLRTWWTLAFSWKEPAEAVAGQDLHFGRRVGGALAGVAVYAAAAWGLWRLAVWRFRREPQRTVR
jgi:ABC-type transport system involved in multi-copper enzyme maturation permease subunit